MQISRGRENHELKEFDLKIGDIVIGKDKSTVESCRWEVIGIYQNLFRCKKANGYPIKQSFVKTEYMIGEVRKV